VFREHNAIIFTNSANERNKVNEFNKMRLHYIGDTDRPTMLSVRNLKKAAGVDSIVYCEQPSMSRTRLLHGFCAFCYVLSRFSRQATVDGGRFVAFNHGASWRVTARCVLHGAYGLGEYKSRARRQGSSFIITAIRVTLNHHDTGASFAFE